VENIAANDPATMALAESVRSAYQPAAIVARYRKTSCAMIERKQSTAVSHISLQMVLLRWRAGLGRSNAPTNAVAPSIAESTRAKRRVTHRILKCLIVRDLQM
jgi:hypothetical protein